jgi:hypothetical protein
MTTIAPLDEKQFTAMVVSAARMTGHLVYHPYDSRRSAAGFPDLTIVHPERGLLFAELKTATGRLSRNQVLWITTLEDAGARVFVWRPEHWDQIVAVLNGATP